MEMVFRSTGGKWKSHFYTVRKVRCNKLFLSAFIITMFIAIIGTDTLSKYGRAIGTNPNLNYQLDSNQACSRRQSTRLQPQPTLKSKC
jgi:hypothetical protein